MPVAARTLTVRAPEPPLDCDVVFSSLPAEVAGPIETRFAAAGYPVLSNSSSHRMDEAVPVLIPPGNAQHLTPPDACRGTGPGFLLAQPHPPPGDDAPAPAPPPAPLRGGALAAATPP